MKRLLVLAIAFAASCVHGEHRDARDKYNAGVAALQKSDYTEAEKLLVDALGAAGVDPELRFRAAYDLGIACAAHADKVKAGKDADLAKAIELEQQAVSWFTDALGKRPHDPDTLANLATANARLKSLTDELRRAEGKLEARLDAAIAEQRQIVDGTRAAWASVKETGGKDPLAQRSTYSQLADKERGIVAEAGVLEDLAGDEIDSIGKKPEDKRTPEEKARIVQLKNLDFYVGEARTRIADTRRKLQQLAAEDAVGRADAALAALKRAREQLLDPITVLRDAGADELVLARETAAVAGATTKRLDVGSASAPPPVEIPAWLVPSALLERQTAIRERVDEVRARLAAAAQAPKSDAKQPDDANDAKQKKLLERVKAALPLVVEASNAMDRARSGLGDKKLDDAGAAERDAIVAIAKAVEVFADLKQTIEVASATQRSIVKAVEERSKEANEAIDQNTGRIERMKELIEEDKAELDEEAKKASGSGAGSGAGAGSGGGEQKKKQIEAEKERLKKAEELRGEAAKLMGELHTAIAKNGDAFAAAKAVDAKLDELRKLFFTVIEHLQQLILDQGETRDRTATAAGEDDAARAPKLPELVARQDDHGAMAKAITDALAAQADAAAKQPQQAQQGGPSSQTLSAATEEVRQAGGDMADAKATIDKARTTTTQSVTLKPAAESQDKAIAHLKAALELLQPPKQKQDQQDQQQDQQDKQDQQQKQKDKQQAQPQGGAGQKARDDDAKRQRRRAHAGDEPVEKDW